MKPSTTTAAAPERVGGTFAPGHPRVDPPGDQRVAAPGNPRDAVPGITAAGGETRLRPAGRRTAWLLVAVVGWVVLLVRVTRRLVPAGRRVAFVAAALLSPVVVSPLVGVLYGWAMDNSLRGFAASLVTVPLAGTAGPPATLRFLDRRARRDAGR